MSGDLGTPLPRGYTVRPTVMSDLQTVFELITAANIAAVGAPDDTVEDLRTDWENPRVDLSRDSVVVATETGRIVGYAAVIEASPGIELVADVYVHPDVADAAPISRHLTERVVVMAELAADRSQARYALVAYAVEDEPLVRDLEACGFEVRRRFWRMVLELDELVDETSPDGVTIGPLDVDRDLVEVHRVLSDAFSGHWGSHAGSLEEWRVRHLDRADADPGLWRVAWADGEVVGVAMGIDEGEGAGWISNIGVRADQRGRGVAGALLRSTFAGFQAAGLGTAKLSVDSENATGAVSLYERAGMRVDFQIQAWVLDVDPPGERTA